ncbi:MAG TPA: bifunctional phosphoribosylaminoimidazolecarboxamide formyltransferase/IMP cyclohydrolase [Pyrinomonadaceae bacterium]|jgi:phosphoribosylaminoimidazolecarboxamide formyltransferase/IMP cyclohydrolase|nr:bifunctional phosphoribosylaminoimidazolecarboxamide formyltransferase/IMP cyclohydrolase [Pyrinomonadaceae bacterium]
MAEQKPPGLKPIRRALLSVSDKTGLVELARSLAGFGVEILSTGGTAKALRDAGIEVRDVSDVTGFPEMLDGRVKTLHPRIHGGILAVRDNPEHARALEEHGIGPIDMVVVNLYPFEQTIAREGVTLGEAVEQIDIGGPSMVRSAAKNFNDVAVVVSPSDYEGLTVEMNRNEGALSLATRTRLARAAFRRTAIYDLAIYTYLQEGHGVGGAASTGGIGAVLGGSAPEPRPFWEGLEEVGTPDLMSFTFRKSAELRYGENPHQRAAIYSTGEAGGIAQAEVLGGKEMSFNNYVDADAAWQLVCDFEETACAIIKHMNPAGVGLGATNEEAYRRALETDPVSAFGGIVAFNRTVDETAARAVGEIFTEVVVAPDFDAAAVELLKSKKNLRILRAGEVKSPEGLDLKRITGGVLVQTRDTHRLKREDLKVVTKRAPTGEELEALMFAWTVCKHTKSNAIVYARAGQTVGVGAGQMSRVDSVRIGATRARIAVEGSVLASDAFFPFRDGLDEAAKHGITAVIQPGGSVRDAEVIAAADEHNLAMVFTGIRHFRH